MMPAFPSRSDHRAAVEKWAAARGSAGASGPVPDRLRPMSDPAPPAVPDPCTQRELVSPDGASVRFCAHGGHVLGWTPAGDVERLWLSRDSRCGPGSAIRGGIPVVWPQFAERGDGPRHGIVRDRAWSVVIAEIGDDGSARVRLELRSDPSTETVLPRAFTLRLDVVAAGSRLEVRLAARNDGDLPLTFTAALHTYLRASAAGATVHGLGGHVSEANDGSGEVALGDAPVSAGGGLDVAVRDVTGDVTVRSPGMSDLVLTADGFDSRVVWNPGPGAAPGDVHTGGESEFLCVEPALLRPVTLAPGATWQGSQVLHTAGPRPAVTAQDATRPRNVRR